MPSTWRSTRDCWPSAVRRKSQSAWLSMNNDSDRTAGAAVWRIEPGFGDTVPRKSFIFGYYFVWDLPGVGLAFWDEVLQLLSRDPDDAGTDANGGEGTFVYEFVDGGAADVQQAGRIRD